MRPIEGQTYLTGCRSLGLSVRPSKKYLRGTAEGAIMTETHFEPFLHLADVGPDRALVTWGGFWFHRRTPTRGGTSSTTSSWATSTPAARRASARGRRPTAMRSSRSSTRPGRWSPRRAPTTNHVWVTGLQPDTAYRYRVLVDGEEWAAGERWDWGPVDRGGLDLRPGGRSYDTSFRTHPDPGARARSTSSSSATTGSASMSDSESSRRQTRVAEVLDRLVERHDVRLVIGVGDNVYRGESGLVGAEGGGEDDDWYSSFYQPYRYVLARIPVYPTVGNHDSADTESSDDREQIRDNFHTDERFLPAVGSGRASIDPGLFYRFGYGADVEFVCIDTSLAEELPVEPLLRGPQAPGVAGAGPAGGRPGGPRVAHPVLAPPDLLRRAAPPQHART